MVPSVAAGLRRVAVLRADAINSEYAFAAPGPAWGRRIAVGLLFSVLAVVSGILGHRRSIPVSRMVLPVLPLLLTPWLAHADMAALLQSARVVTSAPLWASVFIPSALSLGLAWMVAAVGLLRRPGADIQVLAQAGIGAIAGAFGILQFGVSGLGVVVVMAIVAPGLARLLRVVGRSAFPGRGAVVLVVSAGIAGTLASLLEPTWARSVLFAAGVGGCVGLVIWANAWADRIRFFNLISLGSVCLGLLLCEHALTWTATGNSLLGRSSRSRAVGAAENENTAFSSFEALEHTREFRRYPDQDYPVQPPERTDAVRVVVFGSSSTAGAYQNDDIQEFWPADLERELGQGFQVINQGVGGWTTFHIRRYIQTQRALLDPDLAIIYMGHNDVLTQSPIPYDQLFQRWLQGRDGGMLVSSVLSGVRVYQALRFGLQSMAGMAAGQAVPLSDAEENIVDIVTMMAEDGAKVLLVLEGISPDAAILDDYGAMFDAQAATRDDVIYLDGAAILARPQPFSPFLDDCHLSRNGHQVLARSIADALREAGWVNP